MIESILGMLVGAGLLIGGFSLHDLNYRQDYRGNNTTVVDSEGQKYLINGSDFGYPTRETLGYLMGSVGAAIFALSAKRAWDQREKRRAAVSMRLDQTFQQFRTRLDRDRATRVASNSRRWPLSKAAKTAPYPSLPASSTLGIHGALAPSALLISDRDAKLAIAQTPNLWRLTP